MALRSLKCLGWLGTSLFGASLFGVVTILSSAGCGDTSYTPPSTEAPGMAAPGTPIGNTNAGTNVPTPGAGGSTAPVGGSAPVAAGGTTPVGGSAPTTGGADQGTGGAGVGQGGASAGGDGAGPMVDPTLPTTIYCPEGRNLSWNLNFVSPEWESTVDFTFGNGELPGWENDGDMDDNIEVVDDPEKGKVLKVLYRGGSGPNSCFTCIADGATAPDCVCRTSGGVEFYADFAQGRILEYAYLSYWVKFGDNPGQFDWGGGANELQRHEAGKLPGLAGGIPVHGLNIVNGSGFTARGMWRDNVCAGKTSELYWYGLPVGSRNQDICGSGPSWNWEDDGEWHHVQMQLKMSTGENYDGEVQMWYDKPITEPPDIDVRDLGMLNRNQFPENSVSQLMFSTFYGGHDNTWGPLTDQYIYFADVQICD